MNKTIEYIETRRSIRSYSSQPVDRKDLEQVINAGFSAPSAHGRESRYVAVLEEQEIRKKIAVRIPWFKPVAQAPVALLVCGIPVSCTQREYWTVDCAAFTENILIAARALGLGSLWCGIAPVENNMALIRSILEIPEGLAPFSMIALGYPAKESAFQKKYGRKNAQYTLWNPPWLKDE